MKIEPGKFYRCRDGSKARIYAVDGGGERPIHGATMCSMGLLGAGRLASESDRGREMTQASDREAADKWCIDNGRCNWHYADKNRTKAEEEAFEEDIEPFVAGIAHARREMEGEGDCGTEGRA